jgi:hypothetical protein
MLQYRLVLVTLASFSHHLREEGIADIGIFQGDIAGANYRATLVQTIENGIISISPPAKRGLRLSAR